MFLPASYVDKIVALSSEGKFGAVSEHESIVESLHKTYSDRLFGGVLHLNNRKTRLERAKRWEQGEKLRE